MGLAPRHGARCGGLRHRARTKHGPSLPLVPKAVKPTAPFSASNQNGRRATSPPSHHRCPHSRWWRPRLGRVFANSQHGGRKPHLDGIGGAARTQDGGDHHAAAGAPQTGGAQRFPGRREAPGGAGGHDHHGHGLHEVRAAVEGRRRGEGAGWPASGSPQAAALSAGATAPTWRTRSSSPQWPAPWRG